MAANPKPPEPANDSEGGRPLIRYSADLPKMTEDAIAALADDATTFQRDSKLVHVTSVTREESERSELSIVGGKPRRALVEGTPRIHEMAPATLRVRLSGSAKWERFDKKEKKWVASLPHPAVVQAVHAAKEWSGVRPIKGIAEAPFLRPDGTICQAPGYDISTGYLYAPSEPFPDVPASPAQSDAKRALEELAEVFCDFPYAGAAHAAVPIAAILTILARPAIDGPVPGFTFDATTRGSGKSLQTDVVCMIGTGRAAPRKDYPVRSFISSLGPMSVVNDEELSKVLAGYALRGASVVCIDNVVAPFGCASLDAVLTARDEVELRVLGTNAIPCLPWRAVVMASGNNIEIVGDTCRRVLRCRLEPPEENPEVRTGFKHPELVAWVRKERPRLVVAALTVLLAWRLAQDRNDAHPARMVPLWGSFEAWTRTVAAAVVYGGGPDPTLCRVQGDASRDDDTSALATLLADWPSLVKAHQAKAGAQASFEPTDVRVSLSAKEILAAAFPTRKEGEAECDDDLSLVRDALRTLTSTKPGARPSSRSLGKHLGRYLGRVLGCNRPDGVREDLRLVREPDPHANAHRWTVDIVRHEPPQDTEESPE